MSVDRPPRSFDPLADLLNDLRASRRRADHVDALAKTSCHAAVVAAERLRIALEQLPRRHAAALAGVLSAVERAEQAAGRTSLAASLGACGIDDVDDEARDAAC